jgi:N-acetylneuraminate synthase
MNEAFASGSQPLRIGDRMLGDGQPCFVIAEVGNNHNGDYDRAIALVDAAVTAGADCAKFQMRKLDEVYRASSLSGKDDDLAVEYTLDLLRRFELSTEQQRRIAAYCASKGIRASQRSKPSGLTPTRSLPPI